jgi:hypothetical protein
VEARGTAAARLGSGELRPLVNVFVDGRDVRGDGGLDVPLEGAREVRVVGAVAGG